MPTRPRPKEAADDARWRLVSNADGERAYREFIDTYPSSPHIEVGACRNSGFEHNYRGKEADCLRSTTSEGAYYSASTRNKLREPAVQWQF